MSTPINCEAVCELLGVTIPNDLLKLALSHPSSVGEGIERTLLSNQRLEFLGDAIVGATIAAALYERLNTLPEGELTQRKAAVVQKKSLARAAARLDFAKYIQVGRGADIKGRGREAITADAFEAIVGAIFLCSGWQAARDFTLAALDDELQASLQALQTANIKNLLQELTQAQGLGTPDYETEELQSPSHARRFRARVLWNETLQGEGEGASKKEAECFAAQIAFEKLKAPVM